MEKIKKKNWPFHTKQEINSVSNILKSGKTNYWSGTQCKLFEKEFSKKFGIKFSTCISNGTNGLEMALKALGIKKNNKVIVPCKSYFSSASCVINVGAIPIFCDVDKYSQGLSLENLKKINLKNVKAVICVHLGGVPCDMNNIRNFCKSKNIKIIEDCSQAHGAQIEKKYVGTYGDISVWSFCFDKIISTGGEGGMIATSNLKLWKKIWSLKEIGKDYDSIFKRKHKFGFKWVHDSFGSNYRMTEMQASIGRWQLKKLNNILKIRKKNFKIFFDSFKNCKLVIIPYKYLDKKFTISPYRFYMYLNRKQLKPKISINKILESINRIGVDCGMGSCSEIYMEKSFKKLKNFKRLKIASFLSENSMAFKIDPSYSVAVLKSDIKKIKKILSNYKK